MTATLNLTPLAKPAPSTPLNLGGANPQGRTIAFTHDYMLLDGKPCIPVMGEIHFSRCDPSMWEAALLKMKAGGIQIVASYVFWIHIEEDEGEFDWSGRRNLRAFVELCGRLDLPLIVRIGPFAHGECRNGGIPDWLYGRPFPLRSNHPRYLAYVERYYRQIAAQLEGLLFKDGGAVIGIQLENEYMHAGAPWEVTFRQGTEWVPSGSDGAEHMLILKQMVCNAGLDVPIYTCTGWLNSPVPEGELLPMQGGYAFTPWSPDPNYRQPPTREFLFRNRRLHPVLNGAPTYDPTLYPYACCEIGGGIQDTYFHRNNVPPESVEALAVMSLAGGANLIGYYMYHGGTNPVGRHAYLNEFTVPRISYDFQAPIREFGQTPDSYRYLRLLHLFLRAFGDLLAPMEVSLPENASAITPENIADLRFAARSHEGAGFLFLNNYQDHVEMQDVSGIRIELRTPETTFSIPHIGSFALAKNVSAILPFGLRLNGILLHYATTQLLTRIETDDAISYFFFAPRGMTSEYAFDAADVDVLKVTQGGITSDGGYTYVRVNPGINCMITFAVADAKPVRIVTLTRAEAEMCSKHHLWGMDRLILTEATAVTANDELFLYSGGQTELALAIYPPPAEALAAPQGAFTEMTLQDFRQYTLSLPQHTAQISIEKINPASAIVRFPPDILENVHEMILRVDYIGDIGSAFIDGKLVHDNFYNGSAWEIGLKQIDANIAEKELFLRITPASANAGGLRYVPTGMAFRPDESENGIAVIRRITLIPEYKIGIRRQTT
jgi:hypothetical protein